MMNDLIQIEIRTENAAFDGQPELEIARILRLLADKIESTGLEDYSLRDINGNTVGSMIYD